MSSNARELAGYASSLSNFRNKIINGHLKSDKVIKQRGISTITGATGYTYDRWYYDGSTYLYQGIEDANVQNGTYVISWEGSGISAAWKVSTDSTANNGPDATTGFTSVSNGGTFTVNETTEFSKHLWIQFSGTLSNLDKVQVELGTVATPFEHRPYGMELILCQRYYWQPYFTIFNFSYATAAAQWLTEPLYMPVTMRVNPTMTVSTTGVNGSTNSVSTASYSPNLAILYLQASQSHNDIYVSGVTVTASSEL